MANLSDLVGFSLTVTLTVVSAEQRWKAHFRTFQRQADFHREIRIARLKNRTTNKLGKSLTLLLVVFNRRSIKKQELTAAGRISCAKEQPSRCLLSFDWMMLNSALLQMTNVCVCVCVCVWGGGGGGQEHSQRRFIYRGPHDVAHALRCHMLRCILFQSFNAERTRIVI